MSKSLVRAVVAAVVLGFGSHAVITVAAEEKPKYSKAASKPLKAASDALTAKKYSEVIAKSLEVLALPEKNATDAFLANQMLAFAYLQQGNTTEAAKAWEAQLDSGMVAPADQKSILKNLTTIAYQKKDYAKAIELGQRLIRNGGAESETYTLVAQSYYLQERYREAAKFINEFVGDQERRGQTPREQTLQLLNTSYERISDTHGTSNTLEKLVMYYPKPSYWNGLLYNLMRADGVSDRHILNIFRLMQATDTLSRGSDYTEFAQLAIEAGVPGEAKTVLELGMSRNAFDANMKDRNQRLLDAAKKSAITDQASLVKFDTEAKAARTGDPDVALGRGYLSYGMNDKAVEALTRGIGKGGLKTPDEAQLLLGVALLRSGNKAEALKIFKSVKTADTVNQRLAKLWSLHAS